MGRKLCFIVCWLLWASIASAQTTKIADGVGTDGFADVTAAHALKVDPSGVSLSCTQSGTWSTRILSSAGGALTATGTSLDVNITGGGGGGGSGTEYTEGATDASITGVASMMEGAGNTLLPIQGTIADGLLVNLGSNNDVTVTSGTLTCNAGTGTFIVGDGSGALTVDGTVAATQSGTWNINNVSGTVSLPTGAATAANQTTGNTTLSSLLTELQQKTEPADTQVVGDGGGSLTVDAVNLDIHDLSATSDSVQANLFDGAGNSLNSTAGSLDVNITGGASSGTQYTEGDTDSTITGTAALMEGAANTLLPIQGTVADGLLVNLGANNDVTVTGSVTANAGTNLNTSALALNTSVDGVEGLLTSIDSDTSILAAFDFATETTLSAIAGTDFATETTLSSILTELQQKTEPSNTQIVGDGGGSLSVDDGGGSITVDGSVTATISGSVDTEFPAAASLADNTANPSITGAASYPHWFDGSTWDRARGDSTDGLLVNLGSNNDVTVTGTVTANAGSGTFLVGDGSGALTVDATNLDIHDLSAASDSVQANLFDGTGNAITSTAGAIDVNIASGASAGTQYTEGDTDSSITGTAALMEGAANTLLPIQGTVADGLLVNLGANNDVTVTGTVTANAGSGTFLVGDGSGALTIDGTVTANAGTNLNTSALALDTSVDGIEGLLGTSNTNTGDSATSLALLDDTIVADDAGFTPATTKVSMAGFEFDDVAPDSVNEGDGGAVRMSANRNLYSTIRDAAGNERGVNVTAGNALTVDGSASTQPVSGTVAATQSGTWTVQPGNTANSTAWLVTGTGGTFPVTDSGGSLTVDNNGTFAVQAAITAALNSIVDGAIVTLGLKADAKSTATDTTAVTIMQVLKEISFMAQNPAALPSNQSVNVAQWAGATPSTSNPVFAQHDTTAISDGRKVVTTAGTRVALAASTSCKWVTITAETDNTGLIVVGGASTVVAALATRQGTPLYAGDSVTILTDNLADIGLDSTVSTDGVTFTYGT